MGCEGAFFVLHFSPNCRAIFDEDDEIRHSAMRGGGEVPLASDPGGAVDSTVSDLSLRSQDLK
jgi:hypothetical protein